MLENIKKSEISRVLAYTVLSAAFLVAMYFAFGFVVGQKNSQTAIILTAIIIFVSVCVIAVYLLKKIPLHVFAAIVILGFGILLTFIQPIINTPDENAHIARAEMLSQFHLVVSPSDTEHSTIKSVGTIISNSQKIYWQSSMYGDKMDKAPYMVDHVAASNSFYTYIPQAIGVGVAKLFNMNSIWVLWLARLCNLLAYTTVIAFAIKIIPRFKPALFFVSVLPISIQQAASASPDSLITALSLLLIAYTLKLVCQKDKKISYKNIIGLLVLCLVVALPKVTTNTLLIFLVLLIPKDNFEKPKQAPWLKTAIIVLTLAAAAVYYLYTFSYAPVTQQLEYLQTMNVSVAEQMKYILENPLHFATHFTKSLVQNMYTYIDMMNLFGWLEYGSSFLSVVLVFWLGRLCFEKSNNPFGTKQKVGIAVILGGYYFITVFAMYLGWTSVGVNTVAGVQGRYFIPVLMLLPLLFTRKGEDDLNTDQGDNIGTIAVSVNMIAFMLVMLATKYY